MQRHKVSDRQKWIVKQAENKRVIDVGSWGMDDPHPSALYRELSLKAASILGVDPNASTGNEWGIESTLLDCVDARADVVVMGEVLEHVENATGLLRAALERAPRVVLTVPNPWAWTQIVYALLHRLPTLSDDHVAWLDPTTIRTICAREGWQLSTWVLLDSTQGWRFFVGKCAAFVSPYFATNFGVVIEKLKR